MSAENQQRLVKILNHVTHKFAPDRGVTAEYIALILDCAGVTAPLEKPTLAEIEGMSKDG